MNRHDILCCLTLLLLPTPGVSLLPRLLAVAGSPQGALRVTEEQLLLLGAKPATISALQRLDGEPDPAGRSIADALSAHRISVIGIHESAYPQRLREIAHPPAILFVRGDSAEIGRAHV